jgi:hypothetical protein
MFQNIDSFAELSQNDTGSSISKGDDVLSAVSDEIDYVFLHLLENSSLCDRRAVGRRQVGGGRVPISTNPLVPESESELNLNQTRNIAVD